MVPMVDRAKLAELKRLRGEMRRIMAETGVEDGTSPDDPNADPMLDDTTDEPADEAAREAADPTMRDAQDMKDEHESPIRQSLRDYMHQKSPKRRPGSGLVVSVETVKKMPGGGGSHFGKKPRSY